MKAKVSEFEREIVTVEQVKEVVITLSMEDASVLKSILCCGVSWTGNVTGHFAQKACMTLSEAGVFTDQHCDEFEIVQFCNSNEK